VQLSIRLWTPNGMEEIKFKLTLALSMPCYPCMFGSFIDVSLLRIKVLIVQLQMLIIVASATVISAWAMKENMHTISWYRKNFLISFGMILGVGSDLREYMSSL
jgi:hypothetical protein